MLQALMKIVKTPSPVPSPRRGRSRPDAECGTVRADAGPGRATGAGQLRLSEVSDTGKGIEPDVLPRVFELFTTKRNHRGPGWRVYGIVTNHGGAGGDLATQWGRVGGAYLPAERSWCAKPEAVTGFDRHPDILIVDDEDLLPRWGQTILSAMVTR